MTGSTGSSWAVYDGSNRLFGEVSEAGAFTVEVGKTYDVLAVDATSGNFVVKSVSPAAPDVETTDTVTLDESTPPVTTSDAKASYVGTATVKLTASDVAGQGVATASTVRACTCSPLASFPRQP
jgi:hypothetical protein